MKRFAMWTAGLLVLAASAISIVVFLEERAAGRAKAFCDRFRPGTPFAEVQRAAKSETDQQFRNVQDEEVSVRFYGGAPLSLHTCTVKAVGGKVSEAKYSHVD